MRGRGTDFEHRFNTSRWAEDLLIHSLGSDIGFVTVRLGMSEVRSAHDLQSYALGDIKEPDLIVLPLDQLSPDELRMLSVGDLSQLERDEFGDGGKYTFIMDKALAAIEVEFSPYRASEMKDRNWRAKSKEQWERRPLKHANPPVAPNIWVKLEDLDRLVRWQGLTGVPVVVVHLFDQEGFAVKLGELASFNVELNERPNEAVRLQLTRGIFRKEQIYDRVDAQGAAEKKMVFVVTPYAAVKACDVTGVRVDTQLSISTSKKYTTHPIFRDGHLSMTAEFLALLQQLGRGRTRPA